MTAAPDGWRAAERAARESYGRMVALLAWQWRDLAAAEDALAQAFVAALERWPRDGVPQSPDAWLFAVAKRELLQAARHARVEADPALRALFDDEPAAPEPPAVPDRRLGLLFVCAHPALPENVHAPLMLQTVLGLDAAAIANAFLASPSAMAQRLVRAKAKIKAAGIPFEEPEPRELEPRLAAVLDGIYGAYTIGSNPAATGGLADPPAGEAGLAAEAMCLAHLTSALQPDNAEALGLLALLLFCEARRPAQFGPDGRFVPLIEQDVRHWRRDLVAQAEQALWRASAMRRPGAFQLEAAIQSAHCQRLYTGQVPWGAIVRLYEALRVIHPGVGAAVGHATALAHAGRVAEAAATLGGLPTEQTRSYQSYWVATAYVCGLQGQARESAEALRRALGLTEDPRVRAHLQRGLDSGAER